MINDNELKQKIELFFNNKLKVHVVLKNKIFLNGLIIEFNDTFFTILDKVKGKQFIFFSEIYNLERYNEVEK